MLAKSVEEARWQSFADHFSRSHDGWIASLHIREGDSVVRTEVDENAFRGATIEKRGGQATLILTFGYEPEDHYARIIHNPRALMASETADHTAAFLKVDADDGNSCVLDLHNPMREEDFAGA